MGAATHKMATLPGARNLASWTWDNRNKGHQSTDMGTGMIPGDQVMDWSLRQGLPDACDSIVIRHVSGGASTIGFKSYDQGREKWQSETLDYAWLDEEPPADIYIEALTRTNATGGMLWMTFTPMLGMSDVVHMYIDECGLS